MGDVSTLQLITSTDRRGAETFATELGVGLRDLGRPVATVALTRGGPGSLDHAVLAEADPGVARLAWRLRRRLDGVQVVAAHGSRTLPVTALGTLRSRVPFVYRNIGDPRFWVADRSRRLRVTALLRRAAGIAALWPQAAEDIRRFHGIPASRIRVIPNAVPAARFPAVTEEERQAARRDLGVPGEAPVIAWIGSLSPEKAPAVAIDAAGAVAGARLLVAGDGPLRPAVEARATGQAVTFLGQVPDPQRVLAAADVLLLTSMTEGMPAVLIEAGLRGLPVVATDVGGIREIVLDQTTGILVPPGDVDAAAQALRRVLPARDELGTAARERCLARFTIERVAPLWDDLLTAVERRPEDEGLASIRELRDEVLRLHGDHDRRLHRLEDS